MNNNHGVMPAAECPVCHHQFDCATQVDGEGTPVKGDISICIECGEILVFTADLNIQQAQLNDLLHLSDRQKLQLDVAQREIRRNR